MAFHFLGMYVTKRLHKDKIFTHKGTVFSLRSFHILISLKCMKSKSRILLRLFHAIESAIKRWERMRTTSLASRLTFERQKNLKTQTKAKKDRSFVILRTRACLIYQNKRSRTSRGQLGAFSDQTPFT